MRRFPKPLLCWESQTFWKDIEEAELCIRPFCDASYLMQCTNNTMSHVVLVLINLSKHIIEFCGCVQDAGVLLADIENRWASEENPLFFLAFALHPNYQRITSKILAKSNKENGNWIDDCNCLSEARLRQAAKFYYGKHRRYKCTTTEERETEGRALEKQLNKWINERIAPGKCLTAYDGEYPSTWWMANEKEVPQLANLAKFLLDAPVQGADCERLFRDLASFHTKWRSRMLAETTFDSAAVKHHMKRKHPWEYNEDSGKKTTDRRVNAAEYQRIDMPPSPNQPPTANTAPATTTGIGQDADAVWHTIAGDDDATVENGEDDVDEDDEGYLDLTESTHMTVWLEILGKHFSDDDNKDEDDDDDDNNEDCTASTDNDLADGKERYEDDYEQEANPLPPLPVNNDEHYPQENHHYFEAKNYLRNDKYKLSKLVEYAEDDLPSIMFAYHRSATTSGKW